MNPLPLFEDNLQNLNVNEESCSICLDTMRDENTLYTIPECNHKFHNTCIIGWFRSDHGECPLCRGNQNVGVYQRRSFLSIILNHARRKDAPKTLVTLVTKYKKYRDITKKVQKDISELKRNNKDLFKQHNALRNKRWIYFGKLNASKRDLLSLPIRYIKIQRK